MSEHMSGKFKEPFLCTHALEHFANPVNFTSSDLPVNILQKMFTNPHHDQRIGTQHIC